MAEPRYLPPRRPARGAVLRASSVSSASFVPTFLQPCPSLARVTTRRTCSAVLAIFSGGGHSTYGVDHLDERFEAGFGLVAILSEGEARWWQPFQRYARHGA